MKTSDVQTLYSEYILPTYTQAPLCLVKGKGSRVWDLNDKEYIDLFSGWAVSGLGHCPSEVVNAVRNQVTKIIHIPNNFLNIKQARLAEVISKHSFPAKTFFCNSGAEATDGALKFARKYGSNCGKYEIITMKQSFHGRTFGGIGATGQEKVREGFSPTLEGFKYADMNNLESVKALISSKTAAIFLEPIQGEGGIHVATQEFMQGLRKLCDEHCILLICDEVQTGMGRTGKMFAYQHYGIEPDVMTLAKSLGNGLPIGAFVVNKKIKDVMTPGSHGSTYGGNPLAAAAALAVFKAIEGGKLLKKTEELGEYFEKKLKALQKKHSVIKEIRGLGLMRGLELEVPGADLVDSAREKGLLINCTQGNTLRIFPAMTISKTLLNKALRILDEVFAELSVKG